MNPQNEFFAVDITRLYAVFPDFPLDYIVDFLQTGSGLGAIAFCLGEARSDPGWEIDSQVTSDEEVVLRHPQLYLSLRFRLGESAATLRCRVAGHKIRKAELLAKLSP
jgi:hypothetical protein